MTWSNEQREAYRKARTAADPAYAKARNSKREANRKARIASDPEYAARWREQRRSLERKRNVAVTAKARERRLVRPFLAVDGEGVRREDGSSDYTFLRIGKRTLFNKNKRLTTPEILDFVCNAPPPKQATLIGFALEYDFANWLRDVKDMPHPPGANYPTRLERILRITEEPGGSIYRRPPTWLDFDGYGTFGVRYLPRNYLSVCRGERDPTGKLFTVPGSTRTVYDTFGNFQSTFLKACQDRGVGKEHWAELKAMKDSRSEFDRITARHKRYNKWECEDLTQLMNLFRDDAVLGDTVPKTWNGAGKLAAAMHEKNGTFTTKDIAKTVPSGVLKLAHAGYYGGRFECTRCGHVDELVYAHDINSAYPAAMDHLPCLKHGRWRYVGAETLAAAPDGAIFVCPVRFTHLLDQFLCGLPFRDKRNRLSWPRLGNGTYWSPEIRSAERLGARIEYRAGWLYEQRCTCNPFDWTKVKYALRLKLGKDGRGFALKLAINALYGKLAQRVGEPKWSNPIWAGLITARTRAAINDAIRIAGPLNVIMIATDAVFTIKKQLPRGMIGEGLGKWSLKPYDHLFVVRPGLYWGPPARSEKDKRKIKSRGVSVKFLEPQIPEFEAQWKAYANYRTPSGDPPNPYFLMPPVVIVETDVFVGLRLAYRRGDLSSACQWQKVARKQSFDWADKRSWRGTWQDKAFVMEALSGEVTAQSCVYKPPDDGLGLPDGAEDWQKERMLFEAMPDADDYLASPG